MIAAAIMLSLLPRPAYDAIVERQPFLPFYQESVVQEEKEDQQPQDTRRPALRLQGISRFRDGILRAALVINDRPTGWVREGCEVDGVEVVKIHTAGSVIVRWSAAPMQLIRLEFE